MSGLSEFDWYSVTLASDTSMSGVDVLLPLIDESPSRITGRLGYSRGWRLSREGSTFAEVFESDHLNDHVVATGKQAPQVASVLRTLAPGHSVARADVKLDFSAGPAFFDKTRSLIRHHLSGKVTLTDYIEESPKGKSSTLYVGSKSSETRLRLYEKGKQDPAYPADTVRMELQVRPAKAPRKLMAATMEPDDYWGFARWSRSVANAVASIQAPVVPPQSQGVTDLDRSLEAVALQYGKVFLNALENRHGGDVEAFALDLFARVIEHHGGKHD